MKQAIVTSTLLTLAGAPLAAEACAHGTVIAVYPPEYTAAFRAARHLPASGGEDGRFAIVQVGDADAASFALIYVPAGIPVDRDSPVEIRREGSA